MNTATPPAELTTAADAIANAMLEADVLERVLSPSVVRPLRQHLARARSAINEAAWPGAAR